MLIPIITKTYWPVKPGIDLRDDWLNFQDLVPKVGESRAVYLQKPDSKPIIGEVYLLWHPPHTAINGWDDQPSEIVQSQVIIGNISPQANRTVTDPFTINLIEIAVGRSTEYKVDIKDVIPLLPFCLLRKDVEKFQFPELTDFDRRVYNLWGKVQWCGKFELENFTYFQANSYESNFEALFLKIDGHFWLKMHEYSGGTFYESCLTNYPLNQLEQAIFERLAEKAVVLEDSVKPYLIL
jgi:hypothetical protein